MYFKKYIIGPVSLLAELLAVEPDAVARLLAAHRDDGTGHCRVCRIGGQAGFQVWPCSLYASAEAAWRLIRARQR